MTVALSGSSRRFCVGTVSKIACPIRGKRYNSSAQYEDPEDVKKREDLYKRLTGKPLDDIETKKIYETPLVSTVAFRNPEVLSSPFVCLDENIALRSIFTELLNKTELDKYDYFMKINTDTSATHQDRLDAVINWRHKFKKSFKSIPVNINESNLILNSNFIEFFDRVTANMHDFDITRSVSQLQEEFYKLSYTDTFILHLKYVPKLSEEKRGVFINQLDKYLQESILHFHDSSLEQICLELLKLKEVQLITNIINSYDTTTHSRFYDNISPHFLHQYLEGLITQNDVQTASQVLNYLSDNEYIIPSDTLTQYFKLVHTVVTNVQAPKNKKEMLFNLLTKSTSCMLLQDGMLNEEIVFYITDFIRINILHIFVKYLQLSPNYKELNSIPDIIIQRISSSSPFHRKSDQKKAIFTTNLLNSLNFESKEISDACKKNIIRIYAEAHSPLAVLNWSKQLEIPLSTVEKDSFVKILSVPSGSDNVTSSFDISDKL